MQYRNLKLGSVSSLSLEEEESHAEAAVESELDCWDGMNTAAGMDDVDGGGFCDGMSSINMLIDKLQEQVKKL